MLHFLCDNTPVIMVNPDKMSEMWNNGNQSAVHIKNLCKSYTDGVPVIADFCMNVNKGSIYGLLGSSGCGKTTVISCIVGLTKWNSGEVRVLGKATGSGKCVGYMPQDLALYGQLSISEVVQFYGRVYGMSSKELKERIVFLNALLDLPTNFMQIKDLSGGQRRRASLALALIHSPQLLVLDEPTVGVDPLLRKRIWDYLFELVSNHGITILITTHYTEEVRCAHKIGVMRQGHLIFEDEPHKLLATYNCDLLEVAVLQLCKDDEKGQKSSRDCHPIQEANRVTLKSNLKQIFPSDIVIRNTSTETISIRKSFGFDLEKCQEYKINSTHAINNNNSLLQTVLKIYGLSVVQILTTARTRLFVGTFLFFVAFQVGLAMLVMGTKPRDVQLGIVNHEVRNWTGECSLPEYATNTCHVTGLSCQFLTALENDQFFILKSFDSEEEAMAEAQLGNIRGYLEIPVNYSQHSHDFASTKRFADDKAIEGSRMHVRLDHSEYVAAFFMIKRLYTVYLDYIKHAAEICGLNGDELTVPLSFREPVYGNYNDNFTDFVVPGAIIGTILSLTSGMVAVNFITDRKQGTFSRAKVAGISLSDIIAGHCVNLGIVIFLQLVILAATLHFAFGYQSLGSVWLCLVFCMLTGLCSVLMGTCIGSFCKNEADALIICSYISTGVTLYGGIIWPSESMSPFWQTVGYFVPISLPALSLRSIIIRGLGFTHPMVWYGLVALIGWIGAMLLGSIIGYKISCK